MKAERGCRHGIIQELCKSDKKTGRGSRELADYDLP